MIRDLLDGEAVHNAHRERFQVRWVEFRGRDTESRDVEAFDQFVVAGSQLDRVG